MGPLAEHPLPPVEFMEVAPENWIGVGGAPARQLRRFTERYPFVAHGLSLSVGGPSPLDRELITRIKTFLDAHRVRCYSEHLSYTNDGGHLYDLMPIPFTADAVRHVAGRIRRVQDLLDRRIAMENASYYAAPAAELSELEFINAVLDEADCDLLLDVNNVYVNSVNHGYDAEAFMRGLPPERIAYVHVAGHHREADDLLIDTHGAAVSDPVWLLLQRTYADFGVIPTLLERDANLPPIGELLDELHTIAALQRERLDTTADHAHGY
jgi:uncharacterized protein (UPF0276 family)